MLTAVSVSRFTKSELECNLFPRISVRVEPERVEPFWVSGADNPISGSVIAITALPRGPSNK